MNKKSGKVTVNHLWAGQDSGFAINPDLMMNQMSGNLIQGASKVLHEELQFDKKRVTSRDWVSYPILRFKDTPKVTTVLVNRPDRDASGSGEPPLRAGRRGDRERDLRRDGRAHDAGPDDAGPRPRLPEGAR